MLKPKPSAICWSLLRPPPADVPPFAPAVLAFVFKVLVEYIVVGFCDRTSVAWHIHERWTKFYRTPVEKTIATKPLTRATNLNSLPVCVTAFPALLYTVVITTTVGAGLPPSSVVVATFPTGTLQ
jgi:hypothetical protein